MDSERIQAAGGTLVRMLGIEDLKGKRFLDVGSGSGLFSLAARRLGAVVHSFDYDADAVACTRELRFVPPDTPELWDGRASTRLADILERVL